MHKSLTPLSKKIISDYIVPEKTPFKVLKQKMILNPSKPYLSAVKQIKFVYMRIINLFDASNPTNLFILF